MDAPRRAGELEMLVMRYVRRTCESGRRDTGAMDEATAASPLAGGNGEWESFESEAVDGAATGRAFGADVWILRRLDARLPPSCRRKLEQMTDGLNRMFETAVCGTGTRRAWFMVTNICPVDKKEVDENLPREHESGERKSRYTEPLQHYHSLSAGRRHSVIDGYLRPSVNGAVELRIPESSSGFLCRLKRSVKNPRQGR